MKVYSEEFTHIYDPSIGEKEKWYINDHTIIRSEDGWHLFGITHEEPANPGEEKNFAHAVGRKLTEGMWTKQPYALSCDYENWQERLLWAPHVIRVDGLYYMYYCAGGSDSAHHRIHLATSPDLYHWTRHQANPMVIDGFDARDPMVLKVGDEWVMYYTANSTPNGGNHLVACVTSKDLIHWGNKKEVFVDPSIGTFGGPCESPFVVYEQEHYFLFIGPRNGYNGTEVFMSDDPFNFRIENCVGKIPSHAAEVVIDDNGEYYITRCGWGEGGVYIAKLHFDRALDYQYE